MNPLTYKLELRFGEPQSPKLQGMIWNLLQQYAAANNTVPQYRWQQLTEPGRMVVKLLVKERLGLPKDVVPWEKETGGNHE